MSDKINRCESCGTPLNEGEGHLFRIFGLEPYTCYYCDECSEWFEQIWQDDDDEEDI